jgi:glutathione synthase/RimK-type ligase-like ATP-grasp enzyme
MLYISEKWKRLGNLEFGVWILTDLIKKGVFLMLSLGVMVSSFNHEQPYILNLVKAAANYQIKLFRFTPSEIKIDRNKITGEWYDVNQKTWFSSDFQIPDFVYDRCFHGLNRQHNDDREAINWLKKQTNFLGFGLPGKWVIYSALKDNPFLQAFLPVTYQAKSADYVFSKLAQWQQIVLKPEYGSSGKAIYLITKTAEGFIVMLTKNKAKYERFFSSSILLHKWLTFLTNKQQYLIQKYIELVNSKQEPFDLRIFLQKNEHNRWVERGRGIRVGRSGCLTSNIAAGGHIVSYHSFIATITGSRQVDLEQHIQPILQTLPTFLEAQFGRLFELGIDLGVDRDQRIWILDINSKPGRKTIETLFPEKQQILHEAPIIYSFYLANIVKKVGENNEKNLSY